MIVEQPVEEGIPEAVGEREPRGQEVEERWRLASGAGCNDFLDRPRRDHDDETKTHRGHCARGRGRQLYLVSDELKCARRPNKILVPFRSPNNNRDKSVLLLFIQQGREFLILSK